MSKAQTKRHRAHRFLPGKKKYFAAAEPKSDGAAQRSDVRSFTDILLSAALAERVRAALPAIDPLALFDYEEEVKLKERCFAAFFKTHRLEGTLDPLVRAPRPRFYRATSKRRVRFAKHKVSFLFADEAAAPGQLAASNLEPEHHAEIFGFVHRMLHNPTYLPLAKALNHLIIRGVEPCVLIFNVDAVNSEIVRRLKAAGEKIRDAFACIQGCSVYVDPTRSPYYLEARRPSSKTVGYKRLFGSDILWISVGGRSIRHPATAFSQVNQSMLPLLVDKVGGLLQPAGDMRLLDLYCGYGLFSLSLADRTGEAIGIDIEGAAIQAARHNARRLGSSERVTFVAGRLTAELLRRKLRLPGDRPEIVVLDPPRHGTEPGVIEAVAARNPTRVVHIFCGVDQMPRESAAWAKTGYRTVRSIPLDLFPGSANLEILTLLESG